MKKPLRDILLFVRASTSPHIASSALPIRHHRECGFKVKGKTRIATLMLLPKHLNRDYFKA